MKTVLSSPESKGYSRPKKDAQFQTNPNKNLSLSCLLIPGADPANSTRAVSLYTTCHIDTQAICATLRTSLKVAMSIDAPWIQTFHHAQSKTSQDSVQPGSHQKPHIPT